ncbi:sulfhydryl oxidase [Sheeppox virus]|uniref:Sulfhydryl oxidase n=1 Tax=Sheeppox virus TaxID=10266 RepID=A0A2P1A903_SHEV|nr:sulfhydryl oxidase [Sheeppox virus]QOK36628.1 sulfhydryl oxidase [Sheeppox virus]QQG62986.1 sulfhydryl oxidase [Sheeppox virus]
MNPKHWGRAIWTVIFIVITKTKTHKNLELCKKHIYTIVETLPCPMCRIHAIREIEKNNVMSSDDLNYIYFFFITLFNNLASDEKYKINLNKVLPL